MRAAKRRFAWLPMMCVLRKPQTPANAAAADTRWASGRSVAKTVVTTRRVSRVLGLLVRAALVSNQAANSDESTRTLAARSVVEPPVEQPARHLDDSA